MGYFDSNLAREAGRLVDWREKFWSRHYSELVQALREGRPSVVADVRLVTAEYRDDAERTLRADLSGLAIELRLFELDQAQCAENIKSSPDPRLLNATPNRSS